MSRTQLFAILSGLALLILVLEMVRRRRLREEYSWVWLLTAIGYFLVAVWPALSVWVSRLIGSANPASVFTFLGLFFLFLLCIQFSVQISRLAEQSKDLAQQIAILDSELRSLAQGSNDKQEVPMGSSPGEQPDVEALDDALNPVVGHAQNAQRADD
jgi:hypothetical protein